MTNPNLSEIVTHLRTVHFVLVLACILVLLSIMVSPSSEVKTAHDQLQKVLSIRANWETWTRQFSEEQIHHIRQYYPTWPDTAVSEFFIPLEESMRARLPQGAAGTRPTFWAITPLYSPIYLYFTVDVPDGPNRHEILSHGYLRDYGLEIIPGGLEAVGPLEMNTLEQFRRFWDYSNRVQAFIITEFSKVIYIVANGQVKTEIGWNIRPRTEMDGPFYLERRGIGQNNKGKTCHLEIEKLFQSRGITQFNTFFCAWIPHKDPEEALVLLANGRDQAVPENLTDWLAKQYNLSRAKRTFEDQFSALHRVTKDYQELELRKVERVLEAELQRSGDRVEFLGLKFPEWVISIWGAAIIIVTQLYFWLHLRALYSRMTPSNPGLNLAWIGLYPDLWSHIVFLISACILPIGVILYGLYLSIQSHWSPLIFILVVLGLIVTYRLFILIWDLTKLLRLWQINHPSRR
jgi:hypothetical protein